MAKNLADTFVGLVAVLLFALFILTVLFLAGGCTVQICPLNFGGQPHRSAATAPADPAEPGIIEPKPTTDEVWEWLYGQQDTDDPEGAGQRGYDLGGLSRRV